MRCGDDEERGAFGRRSAGEAEFSSGFVGGGMPVMLRGRRRCVALSNNGGRGAERDNDRIVKAP
ncbi:hypothetical protein U9M48_014432 [Paspalum notatum var. saurae]|uniref:Uncharacterized protein n=1 Tax=Paspalum notatum var. saurae TaxID=547442 RepID=A0AAQ3T490_PASNO